MGDKLSREVAPARKVAYFGTEEPVTPLKTLRAGPLTAGFDGAALRYIKIAGKEAIRNIAFVVRDRNWGTYKPKIENLKVGQAASSFEISFDALCRDDEQELRYRAVIKGGSDGSLQFTGTATAVTDFVTNRTGFVVLHPIADVAGAPVEVEHVDGRKQQASFPRLIDPVCPFQDLRALTHEVAPGLKVTCTMAGDAFEMEDHRNWNDASFKTYVRPLAKPWPYTLKAGERSEQSVRLTLTGQAPAVTGSAEAAPIEVAIGAPAGTMPLLGLSLPPDQRPQILRQIAALQALAPQFFVCPFDSRIADGAPAHQVGPRVSTFPLDAPGIGKRGEAMAMFKAIAAATGAELVLEAVLACRDAKGLPSADLNTMRRDMAAVREAAAAAGVRFAKVAVSPSSDLKCTLPGSVWPPCPAAKDLYAAARSAFPGTPIGGGMFSFFTELNRKRPPAQLLDFITHTTCPGVHAGDDLTVMENLAALPDIVASARAFIGSKPYQIGPSCIGARDNPYGATVAANPDNGRVPLAMMDPRQRSLFGAAWNLGYVAYLAQCGVEAVALSAPTGPFGVIHAPQDYPQPWFDQHGGVYPVFHVLRGMARAAGAPRLATTVSDGAAVQAVAFRKDQRVELWLANLTGSQQSLRLAGNGKASLAVIDHAHFAAVTAGPDAFENGAAIDQGRFELAAYGVARLLLAG